MYCNPLYRAMGKKLKGMCEKHYTDQLKYRKILEKGKLISQSPFLAMLGLYTCKAKHHPSVCSKFAENFNKTH